MPSAGISTRPRRPATNAAFSIELAAQPLNFTRRRWNAYSCPRHLHANLAGWQPGQNGTAGATKLAPDRWLLSAAPTRWCGCDRRPRGLLMPLGAYCGPSRSSWRTFSTWALRRSRAAEVLGNRDLGSMSRLLPLTLYTALGDPDTNSAGPAMPFLAVELYQKPGALGGTRTCPESVHPAQWPQADTAQIDENPTGEYRRR